MEKVVSHYIEKVFTVDTPSGSKDFIETKKVDSRDPLMVEKEKNLIRFRFYDVDGHGDKTNYSGMYYFGERVTIKDLTLINNDDFIKRMQRDCLSRRGINEAIFCENANRIIYHINPEDKTIDEVKIERINEQARSIFINQREFFNRVADLLEKYGNDVDIVMLERYCPIANVITGDSVDDMHSIIRTYNLYVNEYKVLSSNAIVNKNNVGLENVDTYIRLSDAIELVKSLYQEYPYSEGMIKTFMIELWNSRIEEVSIGKSKKKKNNC